MLSELEKLKIEIMNRGITVSDAARQHLAGDDDAPLTLAEYVTTSGIPLVLDEEIYVNAPFIESFCGQAKTVLNFDGERLLLEHGGRAHEVRAYPIPDYHKQKNKEGIAYDCYVATHTDRARLSPIEGCAFRCAFCGSPITHSYRKKPVGHLADAMFTAIADAKMPARHVMISGGTPRPEDRGYLDSVYETICRESPLPVGIMLAARDDLDYPRILKEWGASDLSINIELFGEEARRRYAPQKHEIGFEQYTRFIEKAVDVFGPGKIRSAILVGLEPADETLKGVRALAEIGCDPMLSPFRPSPHTELRDFPPPGAELMTRVYEEAFEITESLGVKLAPRCIPCQHNTLTFPRGEGYFYH